VADGEVVYLPTLDHHIYAIDTQSRSVAWSVELSGALLGAPALDPENGRLYIGTFASKVEAVDLTSHAVVWEFSTKGWVWDTPALEDGLLYFGDLKGNFYALHAEDGTPAWDALKPDGPVVGAPLIQDGTIFLATEYGSVYAINENGSIRWTAPIEGGKLYTSPVLAGDLLLVTPSETDFALVALDADGKQVFTFTPEK
jgi:outer membrane protein assembly factor BamB